MSNKTNKEMQKKKNQKSEFNESFNSPKWWNGFSDSILLSHIVLVGEKNRYIFFSRIKCVWMEAIYDDDDDNHDV